MPERISRIPADEHALKSIGTTPRSPKYPCGIYCSGRSIKNAVVNNMIKPNKKFMLLAIEEAIKARDAGDYAVGAILVAGNKVLVACSNRSKRDEDPIAHAETLAILKTSKLLKRRHLNNCILYTTHEPCPMCASAIVWARLRGVVYGARYQDMKYYSQNHANKKYLWRTIDIPCQKIFNKSTEKIEVIKDFMRNECLKLFHN